MNRKKTVLWITQTAILIALLIILQAATAPLGNTIVTGSIVNLLLIVSVMICGLESGLPIATLSPVIAKFLGIGPFWGLIPFIMAGNITLVLLWHFVGNLPIRRPYIAYVVALTAAAIGKFLVLYIGIVQIAIPLLLGLPQPQASIISNLFSIPQLITALIGGMLASILLPILKKAIGGERR